jgi:DNA repair protein RadC
MEAEKDLHRGHRKRLRQRFLSDGMETMSDAELLELLLFYAVPRRDTAALARSLLEPFGSLPDLLAAPMEQLTGQGLSESAAALIKLLDAVAQRQRIHCAGQGLLLNSTEKCAEFLLPFFSGARQEMVYVLALNGKCQYLDCRRMLSGSVNTVSISIRKVVEYALQVRASSLVLAHNHPSGVPVPSQTDVETTLALREALNAVDVLLVDHVIVAGDDFTSMAENSMMPRL